KGKLFDKDGRAVTVLSKNSGKRDDANGEELLGFADGNIVTASQMKERVLVVKDANSLSKYTCFNVDMPSYLPKGYKFDRAELYKDKDGNISNKYINLYFINDKTGKYIYMQQRFADDSTKYELATDGKVEKVKINGVDAALSDGRSINWETKGVSYSLSGKGEISKNDLIKIAESIK
ncbi:MAG: DUF4367 domain-containing protein, partial [Bacillota bacterium]|nr:DUF4367 domain-containing protein [Bacillota bacterium]